MKIVNKNKVTKSEEDRIINILRKYAVIDEDVLRLLFKYVLQKNKMCDKIIKYNGEKVNLFILPVTKRILYLRKCGESSAIFNAYSYYLIKVGKSLSIKNINRKGH